MRLTTERLLLRDFVENDWHAVHVYQSDPRYLRYYPWSSRSPEEVKAFVRRFLDQQTHRPRSKFQFAVVLKSDGHLIGNCGIRKAHSRALKADLGYEIAPDEWGRGYATEAARAVLRFGFEELQLHRIEASCLAENTASTRVLEKLGMQLEGRLRDHEWIDGRWWDTLMYSILVQEWEHTQMNRGENDV